MRTVMTVIEHPPLPLPWDQRRGSAAMWLFILTEAMLFSGLFFSYYYLGAQAAEWPIGEAPKLTLATIMLVILLASSGVLWRAETLSRRGRAAAARGWIVGTLVLGAAFITLQVLEYRDHLKTLRPADNAYGSIFYTMTSLHFLHLCLGLAMLLYVLFLPDLEGKVRSPHRPLHNAALYWHFVDAVWLLIVGLLYYAPNIQGN